MVERVSEHVEACSTARRSSPCSVASRLTSSSTWSRLYLAAGRVGAEVYEADYGIFRQEMHRPDLDPLRIAARFDPPGHDLARPRPYPQRSATTAMRSSRKVEARGRRLVLALANSARPPGLSGDPEQLRLSPLWRTLGNHEARHPSGFARYVSLVNQALQDAAPAPYVTIHDLDGLSSELGSNAVGRRTVLPPRQVALPARVARRLCP